MEGVDAVCVTDNFDMIIGVNSLSFSSSRSTGSLVTKRVCRVQSQIGFVLHRYAYRETSAIIEVFSRDYGRLTLLAKGARRPASTLRGILQNFVPLSFGWTGKSDLKTLSQVDWVGGVAPLTGESLLSAFYVNELLLRFLPKEDPFPELFDVYIATITDLSKKKALAHTLRVFERALLRESGYGRAFIAEEINLNAIFDDEKYVFDPQCGWKAVDETDPKSWPRINGHALKDVIAGNDNNVRSAAQSRNLMRFLLDYYLEGRSLKTRQLFYDLQARK